MLKKIACSAASLLLPLLATAAPVGIDGVLGAEWTGVSSVHVNENAAAPTSNFGAPSNVNATGYDIFLRRDNNFVYAGLQTTGTPNASTPVFANLYFAVVYGPAQTTSAIGFEVTNDRAFAPSTGTYYNDTAANLIQFATVSGGGAAQSTIETAIDMSVFTNNALGVAGFTGVPAGQTPVGILLFLSQSFGYSVAGGTAAYGITRLGFVDFPVGNAVPEPGALALAGLALGALALTRRRAKARSAAA